MERSALELYGSNCNSIRNTSHGSLFKMNRLSALMNLSLLTCLPPARNNYLQLTMFLVLRSVLSNTDFPLETVCKLMGGCVCVSESGLFPLPQTDSWHRTWSFRTSKSGWKVFQHKLRHTDGRSRSSRSKTTFILISSSMRLRQPYDNQHVHKIQESFKQATVFIFYIHKKGWSLGL